MRVDELVGSRTSIMLRSRRFNALSTSSGLRDGLSGDRFKLKIGEVVALAVMEGQELRGLPSNS